MHKLAISICSRDATELAFLLSDTPHIEVLQSTTCPDEIDANAVEILLASPDLASQFIDRCNNLKWLQSTWAGNAPLLALSKHDYVLTKVKDIFAIQMREYVFTYLLHHFRKVDEMKKEKTWQAVLPAYLADKTLGIMGAGSIGKALLPVAQAFDMKVVGLNSSGKVQKGFQAMYTLENRFEFAKECDAIVNLLPDTPLTKNAINHQFLSVMRQGSVLINAGRGEAIDDNALLHALQIDKPALAVLDVFKQEPLPQSHPFWQHPKVIITHHTAAISDTAKVAQCFIENSERFIKNEPLLYQIDFTKGY